MTAAEKLKAEMEQAFPFTKEQFIKCICDSIKQYGEAGFLCHNRVHETSLSGVHTILPAHAPIAIKYAQSEGFFYHYGYNSHGAQRLIFTLPNH